MKTRILGLIVGAFAILNLSPALATTFNYVGNAYTSNPNPADFGSEMTGSVTFSCNPCADGTYYLSGGEITNLQLSSGIYTDNNYADFLLANFTIVSDAIVEWQIFTQYSSAGVDFGTVGSTDPSILAQLQAHAAPPSTGVGDSVDLEPTVNIPGVEPVQADDRSSGTWTDPPPLGAPLTDMGGGPPGLVLICGGLIVWLWHRRRREVLSTI